MIDIHCHLLPLVDDGAKDTDTALLMARMAVESGVDTIVATPHCNLPNESVKNYRSAELSTRVQDLQEEIVKAGLPLTVLPGAEVMCTPDVPELLQCGKLPTLADSNYLLVEFFFDEDLAYMDDMLRAIAAEGVTPVIAHPERYEAVQRMPTVIDRWFHEGIVIQVNKGSILGRLGRHAERTAAWILARGLAHVVASDAHGTWERTPQMNRILEYLEEEYDSDYAKILLEDNPGRICRNLPLLQAD